MLRLGIYFHIFFGLIFLPLFPPLGALFLMIGALLVLVAIANKKAEILDEWSVLVRDAHGREAIVISNAKNSIVESNAPLIEIKADNVGPSLAIASFGETREFLIITNRVNARLSNFKFFINARDYGNSLFVCWYLTYRPDLLRALVMLLPGAKKVMGIEDLNLFDKQDLTAYATLIHQSLREAVEKLMTELNQDPLKIERKSRGFLGIS